MSKGYWSKRALQRMDEYHKDADRVIGKILEAYQESIEDIDREMQKIFNTYSKNGRLSPEEAKQYLTNIESKKYLNRLKAKINTISDEDVKVQMLRRINAPAYRARLTRLQVIKEKLNVECKKLADIQVREMEQGLFNTAHKAYYSTIFDIQRHTGIGFSFAEIPAKQIEEILKNPWSGKHFSKRIWDNTDKLAVELEHTLTKGFMSGSSIHKMSNEIADTMEVGEFAAVRLIRTETTYVANMAELEAYKEAGVEKLMFLATLDLRTSDICRKHDGDIIPVNKAIPGENIPPLHANCRSTTVEVFEDDELIKLKRRARDPVTGESKTVPANMSYKEWYEKNVANNPKAQAEEKKFKNRASDKKQFDMYSKVLGEDLPVKDFAEFQDLKYNDSEKWGVLKGNYRKINAYNKIIVNEPPITKDLKDISEVTGAELVGLEFRLKSKDSYLRKVNTDSNNSLDAKVIDETIASTNDVIRYTFQASYEELVDKYFEINKHLAKKGYKLIKVKNFWMNKRSSYKGVNCIFEHPDGQKFELQFHTPESFQLKNGELHKIYEEARLPSTTTERRAELEKKMFDLSSKLIEPIGIEKIK